MSDELQTTVPAAAPTYPHKLRCQHCQASQLQVLFVGEGHLRAVCPQGHTRELVQAGPDTLIGAASRRTQA